TAGAGTVPVPLKPTLCGLPAASSPIVTLALRLPAAAGVKLTEIVQVAPAANVLGLSGQAFVCAKSPEFVPAIATLPIDSAAVPLFVSVTNWVPLVVPTRWPANVKLDGLRLTAGAGAVPVPLKPTPCGLPAASSPIVTLALRLPADCGAKLTE